jgi:DNA-binding MarR family transcriptional regulator
VAQIVIERGHDLLSAPVSGGGDFAVGSPSLPDILDSVPDDPLDFDPIAEARSQWSARWDPDVSDAMSAATSIMRAQQVVLAAVNDALRPFGLTFARYEGLVLLLFTKKGSLPLGKMGQRLMIHPTSVTNIIDRLEAQGLVNRVPHPTDGRTTMAEITDEGRILARRATEAVNDAVFGLGVLSKQDRQQLVRIIRKLRLAAGDFNP